MKRLQTEPPAWAANYIGIKFADRGRDRNGIDCWGLVRLVYLEQMGIMLPGYEDGYRDTGDSGGVAAMYDRELGGDAWRPIQDEPELGDVALYLTGLRLWHVAMVVGHDWLLHARRGADSCLERMSAAVWEPRLRGIYRYNGPVRVSARVAPLTSDVVRKEVPPGSTIYELVAVVCNPTDPMLRVFIDDREYPRHLWGHVRPRPGRRVTVTTVPGNTGAGSDVARVVATIAITIAAGAAGAYLAGPGGLGFAAGSTKFLIAAGGIASGLAIGGMLAVNALIPPPRKNLSSSGYGADKTSPSLQGARNEIRKYAPMPVVLGEYRYAPPMAAVPYTEVVGDDTYLRMLFAVAANGPVEIDQVRLGNTSIDEFDGVELEVRTGAAGEQPVTLYPSTISEDAFSALLEQADSWTTRTTDPGTTEISIDVTFPSGLVEFNTAGDRINRTVVVEVEYRPVGGGSWLRVNGDAGTGDSPTDWRGLDLLMRSPEAELMGSGTHANDINWSADQVAYPDAKPAYLPAAGYTWVAEGWIYCPAAGSYQFCVDSSDAADVHVDWIGAATWYGSHDVEVTQATLNSTTHAGPAITLAKGWHQFRARVEHRSGGSGGGALAVGWKKPGDSAFTIVPQTNFARSADGSDGSSLGYRWFQWGEYSSLISTTEARTDAIKRNLAWSVPEGQYEVRVRRVTADTDSSLISDRVYWTALRSIKPGVPVSRAGTALIALRIKATDQLNGVVDDLNCRVRSVVPDWDSASGTWITRATSNPASLFRATLQSSARRNPSADAQIDLAGLAAWHERCEENGWTFNAVVDFAGTLWERLADIAAMGRATPAVRDGLWTVVQDYAQSTPRQHFTPRNSWGFSGRKAFPDRTHGLRVQFRDAASDYEQAERIVLADGYQLDGVDAFGDAHPEYPEATNLEVLELFGCTDPDLAWKVGRYYLAVAEHRPEVFTLNTDIEHLAVTRGDMVLVTHDVPLLGSKAGRIKDLTFNGPQLTHLVLDEKVAMDVMQTWGIRVRLDTGGWWYSRVVAIDGQTDTVELETPIDVAAGVPRPGDLFGFGPVGLETREMVVKAVEPDSDMNARLTLVEHAPLVHQADQGTIPPYDPGITTDPDYTAGPEDPVIESIRSDDYVMVRDVDGSLRQRMLIALRKPSGTRPIPSDAQVRLKPKPVTGDPVGSWTTLPVVPLVGNQISVLEVAAGVTYIVQVRVLTPIGQASAWVEAEHTVAGKNLPPPDVASFDVERLGDGTRRYSWDLGSEPPDVAGVLIRYGDPGLPWSSLTPLQTASIEGASPWDSPLPPTSGLKRFGIKMVDTAGNESASAVYVERDVGYPPQENVVLSSDERAGVWPGDREDCFLSDGNTLEGADPTTWGDLPATWDEWTRWNQVSLRPDSSYAWSGLSTWDAWTEWGPAPGRPMVYTTPALDAGISFNFEPAHYIVADGQATVEVAYSESSSAPTNWTPAESLAGKTVKARFCRWRVTVKYTATQPVPVLRDLVVMMRAPMIVREFNDLDTSAMDGKYRLATGDVRIPVPVGLFVQVRRVSLSFNGAGVGRTFEVVDKDPVLGPRVKLYDTNGELADGVIDVVVRGL